MAASDLFDLVPPGNVSTQLLCRIPELIGGVQTSGLGHQSLLRAASPTNRYLRNLGGGGLSNPASLITD